MGRLRWVICLSWPDWVRYIMHGPYVLGNGPYVLGNGPYVLGNGLHGLGNGPY